MALGKTSSANGAKYVADQVLVKFKGAPQVAENTEVNPKAQVDQFMMGASGDVRSAVAKLNASVVRFHPRTGVAKLALPQGADVKAAVEQLKSSGLVEYAEPNYQVKANQLVFAPDDPGFPLQWGLNNIGNPGADINALGAWLKRTRSQWPKQLNKNVVVAVLDTGIDIDGPVPTKWNGSFGIHEDLYGNLWKNLQDWNYDDFDDDANGFVDDLFGADFVYNEEGISTALALGRMNVQDRNGHGTRVAGIIGARSNNLLGVAGINWRANMMILKVLGDQGYGTVDDIVAGMEYALAIKSRDKIRRMVMNASWGGYLPDPGPWALYDAIDAARIAGVLFVTSAGDEQLDQTAAGNMNVQHFYPAFFRSALFPFVSGKSKLDNVISVSSSTRDDLRAAFANFGNETVDLFAPGQEIYTTDIGNSYGVFSGSSYATAFASGSAALLWSYRQGTGFNNKPLDIKAMLLNGTEDGQNPVFPHIPFETQAITEGRLDLDKAMTYDPLNNAFTKRAGVFSVYPNGDALYPVDVGTPITLTGVNFGATQNHLYFQRTLGSFVTQTQLPDADINSWAPATITATVSTAWPRGHGRVQVANSTPGTGISRGAWFTNVSCMQQIFGHATIRTHALAAYAQFNDDLYIFGGRTDLIPSTPSSTVERLNLTTLTGNIQPHGMTIPVDYAGAAYAFVPGVPPNFNDKVFLVGGSTGNIPGPGTAVSIIQIYNILTDSWTTSLNGNLPAGRIGPTVVKYNIGGHDKIYIFGGADQTGTYFNNTWVYDPVTDTINTVSAAPMPFATSLAGGTVTADGKIWIIGGTDQSFPGVSQSIVQIYDPVANTWCSLPPVLLTARTGAPAGSDGNVPVIFAGAGDPVAYFPAPQVAINDAEAFRGVPCTDGAFNQEVVCIPSLYTPSLGQVGKTFFLVAGYVPGSGVTGGTRDIYFWTNPIP
jgi:hypothetical protein